MRPIDIRETNKILFCEYWDKVFTLNQIKNLKIVSNYLDCKKKIKKNCAFYFKNISGPLVDYSLINKIKEYNILLIFPLSELKNKHVYIYLASKILNKKKPNCLFVTGAKNEKEIKNPLETYAFFETFGIDVYKLNLDSIEEWLEKY